MIFKNNVNKETKFERSRKKKLKNIKALANSPFHETERNRQKVV